MDNRKRINVQTLDLLARSLHKEFIRNPNQFSRTGSSLFFQRTGSKNHNMHVYFCSFDGQLWFTIGEQELEYAPPSWMFLRKDRHIIKNALNMLNEIYQPSVYGDLEKTICDTVPSAKDIIAEKTLLDDHKV